jgi:hypothetical protein
MLILINRYAKKFVTKYSVPDWAVHSAIETLLQGKGISLGGNLYKVRLRDGQKGKSGAFRSIWFWKRSELIIFCFLFAKNQSENMSDREEKALRLLSREWNALMPKEVEALIAQGEFERMDYEGA